MPTDIGMMYGLTRSLKNEIVKIAPKGRVNCIAPGWTKTVCHIHFHHQRRLLKTGQPLTEELLKDPNVVYGAVATYFAFISLIPRSTPYFPYRILSIGYL